MYLGREGYVAWLLHRVSGLGVLLFLFLHILDTSLIGFGPEVYETFVEFYRHPAIRVLEAILVVAVIFHAGNGVRVILIDFWPRGVEYQRQMFWIGAVLFPLVVLPVVYIMLRPVFFR